MHGYVLPVSRDKKVMFFPGNKFAWGEIKGLSNKMTLLSPVKDVDIENIPKLSHDNVFRPTIRAMLARYTPRAYIGRMMLWGVIWLVGMDTPLEDIIGGLYLLIGIPLFVHLVNRTFQSHISSLVARLNTQTYDPEPVIVYSPRLAKLQEYMDDGGPTLVLEHLDELGFMHLREFYKRCAWQTRWTTPPPTGAGVLT